MSMIKSAVRFAVFILAVTWLGSEQESLDALIAQSVIDDVLSELPASNDTALWFWSIDLVGIKDTAVARTLEQQIRSSAAQTAGDSTVATKRYLVHVGEPFADSGTVRVIVTYQTSWEESCIWYHSSTSHKHIYRNSAGMWSYAGEGETIVADPAPPPPAEPRKCTGPGAFR